MIETFAIYSVIAMFFLIAERLNPARLQPFFRRGFFTDCVYVVVVIVLRLLFTSFIAMQLTELGQRHFPEYAIGVLLDKPLWVQAVAVVFVLDFIFYVTHRLKHRWQWWWRLHETHHSSQDLDWFSSVRFHPLERLLDRTLYLFPLVILGVSEEALLILAAADALIGSFGHANLNWRIGPLIYLFVGPEMHRWHHVLDPKRRECNYGNILSMFDWIFGTAYIARENPETFGLADKKYPEGSFFKQFMYAFRPLKAVYAPRESTDRVGREAQRGRI